MSKGNTKKDRKSGPVNWFLALILALLSGGLVVLSIPDMDIWPIGWIALVPLLIAIRGRSFWGAFFYGLVTGYVANAGAFRWIPGLLESFGHLHAPVAIALMVLLNLYQALTFALSAAVTVKIRSKAPKLPLVVVFPMVFTGFEFLMPFIFPWYMSNGQLYFHPFIQSFDLFGVSGGTFVMMTFTAAMAAILENRATGRRFPVIQVLYGVLLPLLCVGYGIVRQRQVQAIVAKAPKFKVGLVEPDVGVWEKEVEGPDGLPVSLDKQEFISHRSLLRLQFLSHKLEQQDHPDLIVWPESGYYPWWKVLSKDSDRFALAGGRLGAVVAVAHDGTVSRFAELGDNGRTINSIAAAGDDCYAVAGTKGYMVVRTPDGQKTRFIGNDRDLLAVGVDSHCSEVLAAGQGGILVKFEDGKWQQLTSPYPGALRAITPAGRGFYVGGDNGALMYVGAKGVNTRKSGIKQAIYSLHWSRRWGLVIGAANGTLLAWKSAKVHRFQTHTDKAIRGVFGGRSLYAVAGDGWLMRCVHSGGCTRLPTHTHADLYAISGQGDGVVFIAGSHGTLLRVTQNRVKKLANPLKNDLFSVTTVPYKVEYPFADSVKFIYRSASPLPPMKTWRDAGTAARQDKAPMEDWCSPIRGFKTPVLFGTLTYNDRAGQRKVYNTAILTGGDGRVLGLYKKVHLLVFGEYLPFEHEFPFLRRYFASAGDLSPGRTLKVLRLGKVRFGPLICYEAIIPSIPRKLALKGVDFFVNMTDDDWFGKTAERYQHFYLAVFRSVENRKYLIRVTNTGISAVVDPFGRILRRTSWVNAEAFTATIRRLRIPTFYQQGGFALPYLALFFTFGLWLLPTGIKRKKTHHKGSVRKNPKTSRRGQAKSVKK